MIKLLSLLLLILLNDEKSSLSSQHRSEVKLMRWNAEAVEEKGLIQKFNAPPVNSIKVIILYTLFYFNIIIIWLDILTK